MQTLARNCKWRKTFRHSTLKLVCGEWRFRILSTSNVSHTILSVESQTLFPFYNSWPMFTYTSDIEHHVNVLNWKVFVLFNISSSCLPNMSGNYVNLDSPHCFLSRSRELGHLSDQINVNENTVRTETLKFYFIYKN